jgi:hypothetical protein
MDVTAVLGRGRSLKGDDFPPGEPESLVPTVRPMMRNTSATATRAMMATKRERFSLRGGRAR